ncbi:MAG: hypothetical protein JWP71_2121, partial [Mucilaginibacter sp.]|nr:hypothetical protein [Mucilaginibacter sp.]
QHLAHMAGYKVGNGARAGVQIIHQFVDFKFGEVEGYFVEAQGLHAVGLVK